MSRRHQARNEMFKQLFRSGWSMADIGRYWGLSRERIHQIVVPDEDDKAAWQHSRDKTRAYKQFADRASRATPCVVCGYWVLRYRAGARIPWKTCSPECAQTYRSMRMYLDEGIYGAHRVKQANVVLKNPQKYRPSAQQWARRILENDPGPNRRFVVPGKRPDQLLKELGLREGGKEDAS